MLFFLYHCSLDLYNLVMLKSGICIFFPGYNRATVLIELMNKLLIVVNIKNLYTPYRPTWEATIKKGNFYLEYLMGIIQVKILTHKAILWIGVCCWVNSNVTTNIHKLNKWTNATSPEKVLEKQDNTMRIEYIIWHIWTALILCLDTLK